MNKLWKLSEDHDALEKVEGLLQSAATTIRKTIDARYDTLVRETNEGVSVPEAAASREALRREPRAPEVLQTLRLPRLGASWKGPGGPKRAKSAPNGVAPIL